MQKRKGYKKGPELCEFNCVNLSIPRLRLVKLAWGRDYLKEDDAVFLKGLLLKTEAAENKLKHVKSVVEKAMLRNPLKRI